MDDTEWYGGVWSTWAYLLDVWYTQDDEHPSVVIFVTGTLIGIADVTDEIVRYLESLLQIFTVIVCWTGHLYPTIWLPLCEWCQALACIPECLHLLIPFFNWQLTMIIGNLQFTIAARGLAVLPAVPPALLSKVFRRIVVHNIYLFWFCGCKGKKIMRNA